MNNLNFLFSTLTPLQDDIPEGLKGEIPRDIHIYESPVDKYRSDAQITDCRHSSRDHNMELGFLNTTIR